MPNNALTDDEIKDAIDSVDFSTMVTADDIFYVVARTIEKLVSQKAREAVLEECAKKCDSELLQEQDTANPVDAGYNVGIRYIASVFRALKDQPLPTERKE